MLGGNYLARLRAVWWSICGLKSCGLLKSRKKIWLYFEQVNVVWVLTWYGRDVLPSLDSNAWRLSEAQIGARCKISTLCQRSWAWHQQEVGTLLTELGGNNVSWPALKLCLASLKKSFFFSVLSFFFSVPNSFLDGNSGTKALAQEEKGEDCFF